MLRAQRGLPYHQPQNEIVRIVNNYARMSYNFGPTLLKWMEDNAHAPAAWCSTPTAPC